MLIGLATGNRPGGSGDHVLSLVGGGLLGPLRVPAPRLIWVHGRWVRRHDEDGVPGVRAGEGCGPLSLFRSSTQEVAAVSVRERAASIS